MSKAEDAIRSMALSPQAIQISHVNRQILNKVMAAFSGAGDGAWAWVPPVDRSGPPVAPGTPKVMSAPSTGTPDMIVLVVPATYPEVD